MKETRLTCVPVLCLSTLYLVQARAEANTAVFDEHFGCLPSDRFPTFGSIAAARDTLHKALQEAAADGSACLVMPSPVVTTVSPPAALFTLHRIEFGYYPFCV